MDNIIDLFQKKINSFLFRLILFSYAVLIIVINDNILPILVYTVCGLLFWIFYFICYNKSTFRLFNDYFLIILFLGGKSPIDLLNYFLLILPLINSINFSGKKPSVILYIFPLIGYLLLLILFIQKIDISKVSLLPLIPIGILFLINKYTALRSKIRDLRDQFNSIIDDFYLQQTHLKKPHKIYKPIKEFLNKSIRNNSIEDIFCFLLVDSKKNKFLILNGSKFIWEYEFNDGNYISELRKNNLAINSNIKIEKIEKKFNLSYYSNVNNTEYVFLILTTSKIPIYYYLIYFFKTFESGFTKISKFFFNEKQIQDIKNEEIIKLAEQHLYVNRAIKTMHFIRNRLTPISNLLLMLQKENIEEDKKESFEILLRNEINRAQLEVTNITDRANYLLEKSNNPFVFTDLRSVSISNVILTLLQNGSTLIPNIEFSLETKLEPDQFKKYVSLNEDGFFILISDWLSNMSKYKKELTRIHFLIGLNELTISFSNDYIINEEEIKRIVGDLQNNERNEILKRTTHGIYNIKSALDEMNLIYEISSQDKILTLTITLKYITDEDRNI